MFALLRGWFFLGAKCIHIQREDVQHELWIELRGTLKVVIAQSSQSSDEGRCKRPDFCLWGGDRKRHYTFLNNRELREERGGFCKDLFWYSLLARVAAIS